MDYNFTDEQNMLRDTMKKFVQTEIPREVAVAIDKEDRFPHEMHVFQLFRWLAVDPEAVKIYCEIVKPPGWMGTVFYNFSRSSLFQESADNSCLGGL